jgi:hypothetical protein
MSYKRVRQKNLLILFSIVSILFSCKGNQSSEEIQIGNFYADVLHGITFKYENNQAFLFRVGYLDSAGNYVSTYREHLNTVANGSGQKFGPSAPDYSYNKFGFTTDRG